MSGEVRLDRDEAQAILETVRRIAPWMSGGTAGELTHAGDLLSDAIADAKAAEAGRTAGFEIKCRRCGHVADLHSGSFGCVAQTPNDDGEGCGCMVLRSRIIADNRP